MNTKFMKYFVGGVVATAVGVGVGLYLLDRKKKMYIQPGQYVYEQEDGTIYVLDLEDDDEVTLWENDVELLEGYIKYDIRNDVYLFVTDERNIEIKTDGDELLVPIVTEKAILTGVFTKDEEFPLMLEDELIEEEY